MAQDLCPVQSLSDYIATFPSPQSVPITRSPSATALAFPTRHYAARSRVPARGLSHLYNKAFDGLERGHATVANAMKRPLEAVRLVQEAHEAARQGDYVGAAECYKQILRLDKEKGRAPSGFDLSLVARHLASAGEDAEALDFAGRALEENPRHSYALEAAAIVHARRGEHEAAKAYTLRRLRQRPLSETWLWTALYRLFKWVAWLPLPRRRRRMEALRSLANPESDFRSWGHDYLQSLSKDGEEGVTH